MSSTICTSIYHQAISQEAFLNLSLSALPDAMMSSLSRRAYDMAAIKLKGYDRANTNFPKSQYHHEPFMMVRAGF